jgi:signal transduction histidine kinase
MDRLIMDVLQFTGLSRKEIEVAPVDVEPLVRDIIDERPEFQNPKAQISIKRPLLPVLGHEASLTQCITNLLGNAVKYVSPGTKPEVRIYSESVGDQVRLWFQDNGLGIDSAGQRRLFKMFQRIHSADTYDGTGIGLAIVRKAVERMGGKAGVESHAGKGSRFWLQLQKA